MQLAASRKAPVAVIVIPRKSTLEQLQAECEAAFKAIEGDLASIAAGLRPVL